MNKSAFRYRNCSHVIRYICRKIKGIRNRLSRLAGGTRSFYEIVLECALMHEKGAFLSGNHRRA